MLVRFNCDASDELKGGFVTAESLALIDPARKELGLRKQVRVFRRGSDAEIIVARKLTIRTFWKDMLKVC